MKIKVATPKIPYSEYVDEGYYMKIYINDKRKFSVREGEPEDMNFGRDLSDVTRVPDLMREAYEAGKAGEEFELEEIEEDNE